MSSMASGVRSRGFLSSPSARLAASPLVPRVKLSPVSGARWSRVASQSHSAVRAESSRTTAGAHPEAVSLQEAWSPGGGLQAAADPGAEGLGEAASAVPGAAAPMGSLEGSDAATPRKLRDRRRGRHILRGEESLEEDEEPGSSGAASGPVPEGPDKRGEEEEEGEEGEDGEEEVERGFKMQRVCDRLIEVFWVEKTTAEEWRKMLAYSEEWDKIRPHLFKRCEARAREMEPDDPGRAAGLFRLARKLKEVDISMQQHDALLALIEESAEELDGLVARRRKDFTGEFFDHLRLRCQTSYRDLAKQEALVALANKVLVSVEQHDRLMADEEAVDAAQLKFDDIMGSATLDEACRKIDSLADRQQLDSTLMLMITKAWAAAKESNMMKDEVKDVMYHLYMQAISNMRMLVPKEVRILRHILSLEDPREMFAALTAAFSPGDELEAQNVTEDYLYTTPDKLLGVVDQVLTAYYSNRENTLIEEAKKLMNPSVIKQLEILKEVIIKEFK